MALNERLLKWAECEHEMKKFGKNKKKEGANHYREMIGLAPMKIKRSEDGKHIQSEQTDDGGNTEKEGENEGESDC